MQRREFLKSTLSAGALIHSHLAGVFFPNKAQGSKSQGEPTYDLIVMGGTISGCFAAYHAARKGLRVLLIERRTFLGTEITATLRPWLKRDGFETFYREMKEWFLPDREKTEVGIPFDASVLDSHFGEDIPLFMGSVKKQFLQILVQNKVDILLGTGIWGTLTDDRQLSAAGLALANKFGIHTVHGNHILDARNHLCSWAGEGQGPVAFCVELYGVQSGLGPKLPVPRSLGLVKNQVFIHHGKRKPGQCFLEFHFVPTQKDVENEARQRTEEVCAYLIHKQQRFTKAEIVQMAWETLGIPKTVPNPNFDNVDALRYKPSFSLSCREVLRIYQNTLSHVNTIISKDRVTVRPSVIISDSESIPLNRCRQIPTEDLRANQAIRCITFPYELYLPTLLDTDVVVAGGGTAGAMAALGSLEEGARTVTLEYLPELGGTSTLGRVTGYYAGYKETTFFQTMKSKTTKQSRTAGRCRRGVARMLCYRREASKTPGIVQTNSIICGVTQKGKTVTGLVVEREGRLSIITGRIVIDATGDGDVAVFAGADYEVGNRRMRCTQNYSQWDVNPGLTAWQDSTTNRDYDILWSHQPSEWQRGYRLSHYQAHYYDFSPFLTVRESRRIRGDYALTLQDVLLDQNHTDTICMASSDYDPHHFGDTLFTRTGCLLPHQVSATVAIPYRALLPRGFDNLLISAKAISQTHNTMQFTRMSFDIMTLGYVTGRIAARVAEQRRPTRDLNLAPLQKELRALKILPSADTSDTNSSVDVGRYIADLVAGKPDSLLKIMLLPASMALGPLGRAYESMDSRRKKQQLAKALTWFGDARGVTLILSEMKSLFEQERAAGRLPREYYREDKQTDYWTINQDITLLSLSGDPSVLDDILVLADALPLGHPPVIQKTKYNQGRIDLRLIPFYNRLIILCHAIESLPHHKAVPTLSRFLDDRYIHGSMTRNPNEAGDKIYGAILESRLAATLARCGARRGFTLLTDYLEDIHPMLAYYARQELRALTGCDHAYDHKAWKHAFDRLAFPRPPMPRSRETIEW